MRGRALALALGVAAVTLALAVSGTAERLDLLGLDLLFELRGPRPGPTPIVVIAIDEDSFDELDLAWPFPRALHGRLIDRLHEAGAAVIGLDIVFPEPSAHGPDDDAALGDAVARAGNVVLGAAITTVRETFYTKVDVNAPVPGVRRGVAGIGIVNHDVDRDGHVRRVALRHDAGDTVLPSWDAEVYRVAVARGVAAAPLPGTGPVLVNFRGGPGTFPRVPYHRVVHGEVAAEVFRGRIVLVGATTPVLQDMHSTPFAPARLMPGVEVHANTLDTLLRGDRLRTAPAWVSPLLTVAAALGAAGLVGWLRALRAFLAVAALGGALAAVMVAGFVLGNVWIHGVRVVLGLALGFVVAVARSFVREQGERRRLSRFFSPAVVRDIVRRRDVDLGSSRRVVTVLFSDIRGFTSISERVDAEQVAAMLREYLTEMTEVVFRHGGTVDKYIGDAVMALYNAPIDDPDHAANAVRTALDIQERTLAVSARWEARLGVPIRNGVGIHTGEAVVGTLGSSQRLEYTAIGDTVNLASRLESVTKEHGVPIVVSEATWEIVKDRFLGRELGAVTVKGKARPVRIFTIAPADDRRHPRATLAAAETVTLAVGDDTCVARVRDVSAGGLAVEGVPAAWPVGAAVRVRCEGAWLPAPLDLEGAIAWRREEAAGVALRVPEPALADVQARERGHGASVAAGDTLC